MVKADPKHDYYADLQVSPDADQETIKKKFRLLAKQYHPDRNPGRETEVVAKFQAVQAAHEILCDAQQKAKYDTDRAKYLRKAEPEPYTLRRAQTTKEPTSNQAFKPPYKPRNGSVDGSTRPQPTSDSAGMFAHFTRAAQWDRAKFEDNAAGVEALRNFGSMRGQPPPHPPRPVRPPTAPKSSSTATSPEYAYANGPHPGFAGMARTYSTPKRQGFSPATPGNDEPQAKSAYAYVHRDRDRPWPYQNVQPPQPNPTSPGVHRARPAESPLRTSRSGNFEPPQRPAFGRTPSRYAASSGERTNLNGGGLGRSASVRTSPVDRHLGEHGPFGTRTRKSMEFPAPTGHPRHRSASPKTRPEGSNFEFSAPETSSSEDETARAQPRPKAVPRSSRPRPTDRSTSNDPALMGQYPNKNYTRLVDESQYYFPPPESENVPYRRPFSGVSNAASDLLNGMKTTSLNDRSTEFPQPSHSSSNLNGATTENGHHHQSSFSASDWNGKFASAENIFVPNERDRQSPTKTSRVRSTARNRVKSSDEINENSEDISPTMPAPNTATPSQSPFPATDWTQGLKSPKATSTTRPKAPQVASVQDETDAKQAEVNNVPDPMDIDSNGAASSKPMPSIHIDTESRRSSTGGVNLADLAQAAPFKSSADGLNSLSSDLTSALPFKSQAADQVHLTGSLAAAIRNMNLPQPPRPVLAPISITQDHWETYWKKMQQYMHDWNVFNTKMIDHFRLRQEQVNHNMYHNWVMGEGEGADAQDIDGSDITSPPGSSGSGSSEQQVKAGYSTYMQWLAQDAVCRTWWDTAFTEHRQCLSELGRMRRTVKAIRNRQDIPTST